MLLLQVSVGWVFALPPLPSVPTQRALLPARFLRTPAPTPSACLPPVPPFCLTECGEVLSPPLLCWRAPLVGTGAVAAQVRAPPRPLPNLTRVCLMWCGCGCACEDGAVQRVSCGPSSACMVESCAADITSTSTSTSTLNPPDCAGSLTNCPTSPSTGAFAAACGSAGACNPALRLGLSVGQYAAQCHVGSSRPAGPI